LFEILKRGEQFLNI